MKIKQESLDSAEGIMGMTVFYNLPAMNNLFVFSPNWAY